MRARLLVLMVVAFGLSVWGVPVVSAAESTPLGYPVQGAEVGALSANAVRGTKFWASSDATVGTVRAYLVGTGIAQSVSASIYFSYETSNEPSRLVGRSEPRTLDFVGGRWVDFTLTTGARLERTRSYFILLHSGGGDGAMSIAYDGAAGQSVFASLPFPSMPDPFGIRILGDGSSTRTYSMYAVPDATLPESLSPPVITDPAPPGPGTHPLTVSNGSWRSDTPLSYTYQWQRCHPDTITNHPEDWCDDLAGATNQTMSVVPQPLVTIFRAVVTARNARGQVAVGTTTFWFDSPTTNVVRPVVTGSAREGETLTSTFGEWIGLGYHSPMSGQADRLRLQWQRCLAGVCTDIAGATAARDVTSGLPAPVTYVVTSQDVGRSLRTVVVGDPNVDAGVIVTVASDQTAVVTKRAAVPVNVTLPSISGPATIVPGPNTLTASPGTWSSDPADGPVSFTYQWQTCAESSSMGCIDIVGATGPTHIHVPTVWSWARYRVLVTATNNAGSSAPAGAERTVHVDLQSTGAPVVAGPAVVARTLSSSLGTWLGMISLQAFSFWGDAIRVQWERCTTATTGCSDIPGAAFAFSKDQVLTGRDWNPGVSSAYVVQPADTDHWLRARVTAFRNGSDTCYPPGEPCGLTVWSAAVGPVTATVAPPSDGGGGGAGSGGGYPADLALTMSASRSVAVAGVTIVYVVQVRVKNSAETSGVSRAVVTDVLPAGVELVSTRVNRGPGCSGTRAVSCDLDFLSGELVGTVEIVVRVTTAGTLVNTASVSAPEADPDLSNNAVSVTVVAPAPLTPPVVMVAPRLTHRPVAADAVVRAARVGSVATVSTRVAVDRKATVRMAVRDPRTGKALTLQSGSRLATVTTSRKASAVTASIPAARVFTLKALLPAKQVTRGRAYVLVLTATGAGGKTSQLQIRFLG